MDRAEQMDIKSKSIRLVVFLINTNSDELLMMIRLENVTFYTRFFFLGEILKFLTHNI